MEEEIITPEEEVIIKLRYITDNEGYLFHVSFGGLISCDLGECTEYNGDIPDGYETIEEWYGEEHEKINAWKIVDGNLVYDDNRYKEIQRRCEVEEEQNKLATQKYVNDKLKQDTKIYEDDLAGTVTGTSLFELTDTKEVSVVRMRLTSNGIIKDNLMINITNANILENKAVSQTIGGIDFTVNEDGTIKINGTSTENIEILVNGSLENTSELFFLKKNTNYRQCGLVSDVSLNLYNYDGTNRTLIYGGSNETINLSKTSYITCVTLSIEAGKTFKNVTISPMLTLGKEDKKYIQHKGNKLEVINLYDKTFENNDYIELEKGDLIFHKVDALLPSYNLYPSSTLFPKEYTEEVTYDVCNEFTTFEDLTLIQSDKDINIEIRYFPKDYINQQIVEIRKEQDGINLEVSKKVGNDEIISKINQSAEEVSIDASRININGTVSANGNFKIETDGTMECNGGKIGGWSINGNGLTNGTVFINSDGSSTVYTVADLIIIRNYIMEVPGFELSNAMIQHYDLNGDGVVSTADYTILQNLIGISMN